MLPQNWCCRARHPSIVTKCQACHGICMLSPLDAALTMRFSKTTQHDSSKVPRLPRKMKTVKSKVLRLPRKVKLIFWKRRIAPRVQNHFRQVMKHVWISRSATPATRNEATRRWTPPKLTPVAELTISTAIRPSCERLRTVADGCERLRTVANSCEWLRTVAVVNATSSEHALHPQTPWVKREPLLRIREHTQQDRSKKLG